MNSKDLAPWIAIAITLALSILVPLFTQIANNVHQRKLQHDKFHYEETRERKRVFENFLSEVGGLVNAKGFVEKGQLVKAGAALHQLYIFAPREWFDDLDSLSNYLMNFNWKDAQPTVLKLDRLISEELNNNQNNDRKLGKK